MNWIFPILVSIAFFNGYTFLSIFYRLYRCRTRFIWLAAANALYALIATVQLRLPLAPLWTMIVIITIEFTMSFLFDVPLRERIFCTVVLFILAVASEITCGFILAQFGAIERVSVDDTTMYLVGASISALIYFVLSRLASRLLRRSTRPVPWRYTALLTAIPIVSIIVLDGIALNMVSFKSHTSAYMVMIGIILINMLGFTVYDSIANQAKKLIQHEQEKSQLGAELSRYAAEVSKIEYAKASAHDTIHLLRALRRLLEIQEYSEAMSLLIRTTGELDAISETNICEVPVIDVILRDKIAQAKKQGINVAYDVSMFEDPRIPVVNLCTILGNAMDNAIRACKEYSGDKFIRIEIDQKAGQISIGISNSSNPVDIHNNTLQTTKQDKQMHGYGLKNMQGIAENAGGTMAITYADNIFNLNIIFPLT